MTKKKSDQFSTNANNYSGLKEAANFNLIMFHVRRVMQQPACSKEKLTIVVFAIKSGVICVTGMLI